MSPAEPSGAGGRRGRDLVVVVLDSLRHDSAVAAGMPNMARLGPIERRYSYATWTAPSHYNLLMGLMPHTNPERVFASEHYKADFLRYEQRLGIEGIDWAELLPSLYLPVYLQSLGYRTGALVSMPVLNPATPLNTGFDHYELLPSHNDMREALARIRFSEDRPSFWLLNVGETHYPYSFPGADHGPLPHVAGLHGVVKRLGDPTSSSPGAEELFDPAVLDDLRGRQIEAASHVDGVLGELYAILPEDCWVVVTSDHGELFGEQGQFGHGPIQHPKVHEVPFAEGVRP